MALAAEELRFEYAAKLSQSSPDARKRGERCHRFSFVLRRIRGSVGCFACTGRADSAWRRPVTGRGRMRYLTTCVAFLGATMLLVVAPATAHFDSTSKYTHTSSNCSSASRVGPINVVFYTWGTWARAENQVHTHGGWSNASGSSQYFFRPQHLLPWQHSWASSIEVGSCRKTRSPSSSSIRPRPVA